MRPRTMVLLLFACLALGWYLTEPTTTSAPSLVQTPGLPSGSLNLIPLVLLAIIAIVITWPWYAEFREARK